MRWGPRKLKRVLERDQPGRSWPAASTMGELLKREELVVAHKKRRHTPRYSEPLTQPTVPTGCGARISRAGSVPATGSA